MSNIKSGCSAKMNIKTAKARKFQGKIKPFNNYGEMYYSDLNNDGKLNKSDVDVLSKATDENFIGPLPQYFDFNQDNKVNKADVEHLSNFISQQNPNYSPGNVEAEKKVGEITDFAKNEYDKIQNTELQYGEDQGSKFRKWYDSEYGTNLESGKYDWCAAFITYLMAQNGGIDKYIKPSTFADNLVRDSVKAGYGTWYEDSYYNEDKSFKPQPGDLILFDPRIANSYYEAYPDHVNDPNNTMHDKDMYLSSHIGYVYDVDDEYVYTIEGNKSNQLKKCRYSLDFSGPGISSEQRINGYYRPNY